MIEIILPALEAMSLGVATNAVYDEIKNQLSKPEPVSQQALEASIDNVFTMYGMDLNAHKVVEMLAHDGLLKIENTKVYGHEGIVFGANQGQASMGFDSQFVTDKTSVTASGNAQMVANNNAQMVQGDDGSITISVGKGGSFQMMAGKGGQTTLAVKNTKK
ncbi:hypothetical protein [Vibrio crassostreae]|uniref:hypothetical protein n=1 Tax=Vibrio crassostreae TaxID=246167 RepID=UPI001B3023B1|nr:hypothetical protein [Vibrio crassostreae]